MFGCSRDINIYIHGRSSETDNRQKQHKWNTNGGAGIYASAEHYRVHMEGFWSTDANMATDIIIAYTGPPQKLFFPTQVGN